MADQIPPAERLLNLVIALANTAGRMTKEQIRSSVVGYADAGTPEAFERMFERDKDALRDLGIPIVTVNLDGPGDDVGYRIDMDAYALPPVELTAAELGVLSLAARFWQDQLLRTDAERALTKLRAVAPGPTGMDTVAGLSPRTSVAGPGFGPLLDAIQQRRVVAFDYRAANTGIVAERHVEPWRLVARHGGWYLVGHDRDRIAPRSFRLSRIEGRVRATGRAGAYTVPPIDARALAVGQPGEERAALLAVLPERAGAVRARSTPAFRPPIDPRLAEVVAGRDLLEVTYRGTSSFAAELAGYGAAVVVLEPEGLRREVLARLRAAVALPGLPAPADVPEPALPADLPDPPAPRGRATATRGGGGSHARRTGTPRSGGRG